MPDLNCESLEAAYKTSQARPARWGIDVVGYAAPIGPLPQASGPERRARAGRHGGGAPCKRAGVGPREPVGKLTEGSRNPGSSERGRLFRSSRLNHRSQNA